MRTIGKIIENGKCVGIISGADAIDQTITVNGRQWHFDFDTRCGPYWFRKDGEPRKCQNPNKAVWRAFEKWLEKWEN